MSHVDAAAVIIMSTLPLATGLAIVALVSRRWRAVIAGATIIAPGVAVLTIGAMTVPAHFGNTSTLFLAAMHLILIPAALRALRTLGPAPTHDIHRA